MERLFISGLKPNIQEMDIAILVSIHGELKAIKVVRDRKTSKCKGYAFLDVGNEEDGKNIIDALNKQRFQGNIITVKVMEENKETSKQKKPFKK